jgi:hypothetical protein
MQHSRVHPFLASVAFASAALATAALTGCAALNAATAQHTQVFYPKWTDAPTSGEPTSVLPRFVPHDATNVNLRTLAGHGKTMRFTSASPVDPTLCQPGKLTGRPRMESNWWPETKPPTEGTVCSSGWRLFELDGTTYGWTAR